MSRINRKGKNKIDEKGIENLKRNIRLLSKSK